MKCVAVIGAGPAGSHIGKLLAQSGYKVDIYEDNIEVGEPFQCTGICTRALLDLVDLPDNLLLNELTHVRVVAPGGDAVRIRSSDIVFDRIGFDKWMADEAVSAGCKLHKRHKYVGLEGEKIVIETPKGTKKHKVDILIGADGPRSAVAQSLGILGEREFYIGAQTRMEKPFDKSTYEVHLDVPHFFGWSVPENNKISRVGIGVFKQPHKHFTDLVDKYGEHKKRDHQGGLIPVYNPTLQISKHVGDMQVYLTGDAATFVKATTGGGIVQGLIAGNVLHECITKGGSYERKILWALKKDLRIHLFIRDTLNKFHDEDYDELVRMLRRPAVRTILEKESRDYPLRYLTKLFFAAPDLAKFGKVLLRKKRALE